jgi:hypothetical protein
MLLLLLVPGAREPEQTAGAPLPSEGLLPHEDGVRGAFADAVPPLGAPLDERPPRPAPPRA